MLLKGLKVIVPRQLRSEMLQRVHEDYLGVEKCQARARQLLYWPNINKHIEERVSQCSTCQKYPHKQTKEPIQQHEVQDEPWQKIGVDLFFLQKEHYLVAVDYTSNFPEVAKLKDLSTATTVSHLKSCMARHGIPRIAMTDNGPHFDCREFRLFANNYGFEHHTFSPRYP